MMQNINFVKLCGKVGSDKETYVKTIGNGKMLVEFCLITSSTCGGKIIEQKHNILVLKQGCAEYLDMNMFEDMQAEVCGELQYVRKFDGFRSTSIAKVVVKGKSHAVNLQRKKAKNGNIA